MNEATIKQKLTQLYKTVARTPLQGTESQSNEGIFISHGDISKMPIEESLEDLRVHMTYVVFDLEATRRENRYLRQMLESRPRPDSGDAPDK